MGITHVKNVKGDPAPGHLAVQSNVRHYEDTRP